MPNKPKKAQKEMPTISQERDNFLTPNYAIDLLVPFLPTGLDYSECLWECCAGTEDLIGRRLRSKYDYLIKSTSLETGQNFLTCDIPIPEYVLAIITNPPFSLKQKIIYRAIELDLPFAFLLPTDYCGWIIDVIQNYGCEKIIPTKRIDYLTPNTVQRVVEGETFGYIINDAGEDIILPNNKKAKNYNEVPEMLKNNYLDILHDLASKYQTIYDIPNKLLAKYSTSQFHSMWLTRKFGLGKTETFVELTKEMKENIL